MKFVKDLDNLHYCNDGIIDLNKYSYDVIKRVYRLIPWRRMDDVQGTLYKWLESVS